MIDVLLSETKMRRNYRVVCDAICLDWEQAKISDNCSEISRITFALLPDCGPAGGRGAAGQTASMAS